jgi:hypothetical protein
VAAWLGEVLNVASERGDDPPSTHERADGASAGTRGRAGMYSRGADPANV